MSTCEYLEENEADRVFQLIKEVFQEHVAPEYSERGIERFFQKVTTTKVKELSEGKDSFVLTARQRKKIIGMIAVRDKNHISLIFVESNFQSKGIGKRLVEEAIKVCQKRDPAITTITVNSSPNSEKFYERIGFMPTDGELGDHGLRYKPMKKDLVCMSEPVAGGDAAR
jgi:GNAT superfamily N-acetyltransferase